MPPRNQCQSAGHPKCLGYRIVVLGRVSIFRLSDVRQNKMNFFSTTENGEAKNLGFNHTISMTVKAIEQNNKL